MRAIFLVMSLITLCAFVVLAGITNLTTQRAPRPAGDALKRYQVFSRDKDRKALSDSPVLGFLAGSFFCMFFYWATPFLVWRYGPRRTLLLIAIPFVGAFALGRLLGLGDPLVGMLMQIPFRAAAGLWIRSRDQDIHLERLVRTGWTHVGSCRASSAKMAIEIFFPSSSRRQRWHQRLFRRRVGI